MSPHLRWSLRTRILVVFGVFAIVPLLVMAGFAYHQSLVLLRTVLRDRVSTVAEQAAGDLAQRYGAVSSHLRDVGDAGAAEPPPFVESWEVRRASGSVVRWGGGRPRSGVASEECDGFGRPTLLRVAVALGGVGGQTGDTLSAWISSEALLPAELGQVGVGARGTTLLVHRETGTVVFAPGCQGVGAPLDVLMPSGSAGGDDPARVQAFEYDADGALRVAALAGSPDLPWMVLTSASVGDFTDALADLPKVFGLFILLVVLSTSLAFSVFITRVMRSLGQLTSAAEQIGRGDFGPELPPAGGDEVGRLSSAISAMADRLRQMVVEMERHSRMAAAGELASYLAHEIRNPLSSIKLNLQSIEREVSAGSVPGDFPQAIDLCLREVHRLDGVVRSVLKLGSSRPSILFPCRVHAILESALALVEQELGRRGIRIRTDFAAADDRILGDAQQLEGAVLNLLINASDAMPGGGTVHVRTTNEDSASSGAFIAIRVQDEGPGIPEALRDRVFETFYTTKPEGSGLGLPLARRTAEEHGGSLDVGPQPILGVGAELVLRLPVGARPGGSRPGSDPSARGAARRTQGGGGRPRGER